MLENIKMRELTNCLTKSLIFSTGSIEMYKVLIQGIQGLHYRWFSLIIFHFQFNSLSLRHPDSILFHEENSKVVFVYPVYIHL